jgi:hypothetical protein
MDGKDRKRLFCQANQMNGMPHAWLGGEFPESVVINAYMLLSDCEEGIKKIDDGFNVACAFSC